ncbi:MAG TPA: hypothetical protein VF768_09555, partial [Holophagaceae bacterium]
VRLFREQIEGFRVFLVKGTPDASQQKDIDFLLTAGEIFTLVVYGQLILENARMLGMTDDLVDQIFEFMVRDFSAFALQLHGKPSSTEAQQALCLALLRKPLHDEARFERMLAEVMALKGAYEMAP